MIAFLAMLLPPIALIPIHEVVQLGSNGGRVAIMAKDVSWRPILPFTIGAIIGAGLGGAVVVQLALGIFIIWAILVKMPPIQKRYVFWRYWEFYNGYGQDYEP